MTPSKGRFFVSNLTDCRKSWLWWLSVVTSQSGMSAMRRSAPETTLRLLE